MSQRGIKHDDLELILGLGPRSAYVVLNKDPNFDHERKRKRDVRRLVASEW
jgi:hypothetical protein